MSSFSHYISELSDIFERNQDALAEKENKLKDKVKHNDLDRHRKVEEKQSAIEDELSSFSKCTDRIKSERLKEIQDAEEEINKSISDIEEQEKRADIRWENINNFIMGCRHKMTKKYCILSFSLTSFIFFCGTLCWAVLEEEVDDFLWGVLPCCGGCSIILALYMAIIFLLVPSQTTKTLKLR